MTSCQGETYRLLPLNGWHCWILQGVWAGRWGIKQAWPSNTGTMTGMSGVPSAGTNDEKP